MGRAESYVESYIIERVKAMGGTTRKVTYQGRSGSPDRWCFLPGGRLIIIEAKSKVGRLSAIQKSEIEDLKALGFSVFVVHTREEVDAALKA